MVQLTLSLFLCRTVLSTCAVSGVESVWTQGFKRGSDSMRLLLLGAVIAYQGFAFAPQSACQETKAQPERLHFSMPFPSGHKVIYELVASSAQRVPLSTEAESVLKLRGDVEMTTMTCRPTGNVCDKSPMVQRADAVDYNERTGEIQTHGDVHIILIDPVSKTVASN
jgi:hypothetical protein